MDSQWGRAIVPCLNRDVDSTKSDTYPLTWFAVAMHAANASIRRRFPDPIRVDRAAYCHWLAARGRKTLDSPPCFTEPLVRDVTRIERLTGRRLFRRRPRHLFAKDLGPLDFSQFVLDSARWADPEAFTTLRRGWPRQIDRAGVNVVGHVAATSGFGEATRSTLRSAMQTGYGVSALDLGPRPTGSDTGEWHRVDSSCRYDINVLHDNVLYAQNTLAILGRRFLLDRYNIGFWYWELADLPDGLHRTLEYVDELWVSSEFTAQAFRPHTAAPVTVVPLAVDVRLDLSGPTAPSRPRFNLPEDRFLFLAMASAYSVMERKNPGGVIDAFTRAFEKSELRDVGLVLKLTGLQHAPALRARIAEVSASFPVYLIDEPLTRNDTIGLINCSDVLVSLHRAEGFGLPLAEAMALGKVVVATRYAGNMDFTSDHTALLVDYTLTEIGDAQGVYPADLLWAAPDIDDAADKLGTVFRDSALRTRVAKHAQDSVLKRYTTAAATEVIKPRLEGVQGRST